MAKRKIYIDSCCFIDMAKHRVGSALVDAREREVAFLRLLLEAARDDEVDAFTSTLTIVECLQVDGKMSDEVRALFKGLLTSGQYVKLIAPDPFIAEDARDLKWVHEINIRGRGGADYIHAASAIARGCHEIITFDEKGLHKEKKKIALLGPKVLFPSDTTSLSDDRRQVDWLKTPVVEISAGARARKRKKTAK